MSTTGASAPPPPPPPGGQDPKTGTGHSAPLPPPASGDGKTPATAAWAPALRGAAPPGTTEKTYVVDGLGLSPRYIRTTLSDAHSWAQTYTILDGDTYQLVTQLPAGGPMVNPETPVVAMGVAQQMAAVLAHESAVAAGDGPVAAQYHAHQAHHGDAYASSGAENNGNSSDEVADSSSAPSSGSGGIGGASSSS